MHKPTADTLDPSIHPKTRSPAAFKILFLLIFALAAAVRLINLTRYDVGTDEAHSFLTATAPQGIFAALQNDTNPPLYFFLLKGWLAIAGSSLFAMRLLSAIFGIAAVVAIGGITIQCRASRQTTVWAILLAALTPTQIHYAQLARGYTLSYLLFALALWSFIRAVQSNKARAWAAHGLVLLLGTYAHALFFPLAAGFAFTAILMHLPRRQFLAVALTYAIVMILALPGLLLILHQAKTSGGTAWLRDYWLATPPFAAIPKSLALLALGGNMPRYLLALPLPQPLQLLALALTGLAAAAFFWPQKKTAAANRNSSNPPPQDWRILFITFTLWPLAFIWVYSFACTPIYLVGRYDSFAQPAYLILLASGFARLQNLSAKAVFQAVLPTLVTLILTAGFYERSAFPLDSQIFHHRARMAYVAGQIKPGERILCTGLEGSPTLYWLHEFNLSNDVATLPRETLTHLGWLISDDQIMARQGEWPAEIRSALDSAAASHTRIWIFLDSAIWNPPTDFAPTPRQALALAIVPTALANGWRRAETDPARQAAEDNLRIVSLVQDSPPAATAHQ